MMNHHYRLNRLTAQVCATKPSTKPASDPSGLFGRGYAHSEQIEVLPTLPPGATFDDKMRAKYEEFQEKRLTTLSFSRLRCLQVLLPFRFLDK